MSCAILFPGQGAQYVGMGESFWEQFPEARDVFERADAALGFALSELCFEGPLERLEATDVCQPAILTTSLAIVEVLKHRRGLEPRQFRGAAGLSLGEYSALCFAGVLTLEDAVRLVRSRGLYMQEDSERNPSGMVTLIGASREVAQAVVSEAASAGVLVAANYLAPGQIVLSGANAAIDAVEGVAARHGIRRTVRLKVAGAFHSPLMASAARKLDRELERVAFKTGILPVVSNVTADVVETPSRARELLARQVLSPVLWEDSMRLFERWGVGEFLEVGPGRVLSGLARKVIPGAAAMSVDRPEEIELYPSGQRQAAGAAE
ncbi:MAG: ACP S-malonyltransferase [Planctomycetota bacterium]